MTTHNGDDDAGALVAAEASSRIKWLSRRLVIVSTDMPRGLLADTSFPSTVGVGISREGIHLVIDPPDTLEERDRSPARRVILTENLIRLQTDKHWQEKAAADLIVRDPAGVQPEFRIRFAADEPYWIKALAKLLEEELGLMVAPF